MKTATQAANERHARKIAAGTHVRLAAKLMKADAYHRLQTAWKQSGLTWDDFVLMLLNSQDDGK